MKSREIKYQFFHIFWKPILKKRKIIRRIKWSIVSLFVLMNVVAYFHAYKLTHYSAGQPTTQAEMMDLTFLQKVSTLIFGVSQPHPVNTQLPNHFYETINIQSNKNLECWSIRQLHPKGTVILFHGFGGEKSGLLAQSEVFYKLGYNTLLVDFMGSGGSEGDQTTIGFLEAQEVQSCYNYLRKKHKKNIYLYGSSMGAVAIMKAMNDYELKAKGVILECPFGTMSDAVKSRFRIMNIPTFPMSGMLVFWGGVQNGFWAFDHNPTEYATKLNLPVLLMYGDADPKVTKEEIDLIYANIPTKKKSLVVYPDVGHESYLNRVPELWTKDIATFFSQ